MGPVSIFRNGHALLLILAGLSTEHRLSGHQRVATCQDAAPAVPAPVTLLTLMYLGVAARLLRCGPASQIGDPARVEQPAPAPPLLRASPRDPPASWTEVATGLTTAQRTRGTGRPELESSRRELFSHLILKGGSALCVLVQSSDELALLPLAQPGEPRENGIYSSST